MFTLVALAANAPVSAQSDWRISSESVFVGNQRVLRVAATDKLTASQRVAIIYQRLTVLQGNYPNFDPQRISLAGVTVTPGAKGGPLADCPDRLPYSQLVEWVRSNPSSRLYVVIGYLRLLQEPAFVGEEAIGSRCAYVIRDNGDEFAYVEKVGHFVPIVTVLPQDAKLHGWGAYEINLALEWNTNLRQAFEALK